TSITAQYSPITKSFLESKIAAYGNIDNVWTDQFLDSLFISYDGQFTGFFQDEAEEWPQASNISHLYLTSNIRLPKFTSPPVSQIEAGPPAGPYFTMLSPSSSHLDCHATYRLRKDEYASFLFGAIPDPSDGWFWTTIDENSPISSHVTELSTLSAATTQITLGQFTNPDTHFLGANRGSNRSRAWSVLSSTTGTDTPATPTTSLTTPVSNAHSTHTALPRSLYQPEPNPFPKPPVDIFQLPEWQPTTRGFKV
ncbi:hypothetical protein E4T56_gene5000, partial [Termitomyces sp. T112]